MKHELWVEVEEAYTKAVELPPAGRTSFLNAAYGDRPDVRREVESLLQHRPAAESLNQLSIVLAAAQMFSDDDADLIGTVVAGKYLIRERLGAGGMAEVYRADHLALRIPVALKRPKPAFRIDPGFRKSFLEEAQRAVILNHDNVARVHDVVDDDNDIFVVMEYIEGETLRSRLSTLPRPITMDKFLPLAIQCASALAAAHEKRIVHLDVKPENIMLTPAGQVKICDFGIARRLAADISTATTVLEHTQHVFAGTPAYMAPEVVLRHPFDERADLFSLGIVFYEMLTGSNPFASDTIVATSTRISSLNPPPVSVVRHDIDPNVDRIVARMLAKDPNERYATAADLVKDLTRIDRSRRRLEDMALNIQEAFTESRWMKVAAVLVLFALIIAPLAWVFRDPLRQRLGIIPLPAKKTIVVLPFRVDGDSPSEHHAFGLTDVLTERLGQIRQLRVVSPVEVFESGITTPRQAFGLLGANLAVTGSIHRTDDAFQVVLSVVDGKEGKQLRGKTLTSAGFNWLAVESQIIQAVLTLLNLEIEPAQQLGLHAHGTENPNAYDLYLEGTGHLASRKPEGIDIAIGLFRDALALDSNFSLAYAGLGDAYRVKFELQSRDRQWADRATDACHQAVALNPSLAAGHVCLGAAYNLRGEDEAAVQEYELARQLDPNDDDVYRGLARSHEALNHLEAAEAIALAAIKAKPDYWYNYVWVAQFYLFSRPQYGEAVKWYNEAIVRAPDNFVPYLGLCGAYILLGNYEDAVKACKRSISLGASDRAYNNLGVAYFGLRQYPAAAQSFEAARQLNPKYYRSAGQLARTYYWMGKRAEAIDLYAKAIELAQQELAINPGSAAIHVMLARYHAMLNQRADAISHLQIALQKRPKDAEYQCIAAVVHNQFGERAEAIRYLENAVAFGYSVAEVEAERELDNLREDPRFRALLSGQAARR
jgi:serine/threonine protein kinase/tetratricopeptide (TPR) repeat protein/TolB-like protein